MALIVGERRGQPLVCMMRLAVFSTPVGGGGVFPEGDPRSSAERAAPVRRTARLFFYTHACTFYLVFFVTPVLTTTAAAAHDNWGSFVFFRGMGGGQGDRFF
jgi:hypothetical protein